MFISMFVLTYIVLVVITSAFDTKFVVRSVAMFKVAMAEGIYLFPWLYIKSYFVDGMYFNSKNGKYVPEISAKLDYAIKLAKCNKITIKVERDSIQFGLPSKFSVSIDSGYDHQIKVNSGYETIETIIHPDVAWKLHHYHSNLWAESKKKSDLIIVDKIIKP